MLEALIIWLEALIKTALIWTIRGMALAIWYVEKAAAWVSEQIITSTIWETIVADLLTTLGASLPDTLRSVLFGTGGGLFYIALIGVSIVLVVPHLLKNGNQPVRFERVMGWSMLVIVMFISSTIGYDAISNIEQLRMQTISGISSGWGAGTVSDFVARPMSATAVEINVNEFLLPAAFAAEYFPEPTAYEVIEIIFYDAPIIGTNSATVTVETDESLAFRITQASLGIVITIINLIPTMMVVILALSFATLTASALVLILFFLLALPVGLFEIGGALLSQIASRYVVVWALSIFIATFPAMMLGVAELTLTPPVTLPDLFTYAAVLLVAIVAVQHVAKWVFQVVTDIFAGIGQTINTTLMPQMYGSYLGPTPTPSQVPAAAATIMGAATVSGLAPGIISSQVGNAIYGTAGAVAVAGTAVAGWAYGKRQNQTQPNGQTAETTSENTQLVTQTPQTHVFAYLDDPDVIEGEFEPVGESDTSDSYPEIEINIDEEEPESNEA